MIDHGLTEVYFATRSAGPDDPQQPRKHSEKVYTLRMDRSRYKVWISRASDAVRELEQAPQTTPAQRLAMVWRLTLDSWTFAGKITDAEPRLQRHVVRVLRGQR